METLADLVLIVLILSVAVWSIVAREAFSAIVIFMIYGLLLSLAWVRLAAPDVALTESAVGSGVTGMLLLNAAAQLREKEGRLVRASVPFCIFTGILALVVSTTLAMLVLFPANDPVSLAPQAMMHLPESGLGNPVAGVLFVYRAFDTFLEKVVLLLALIGVWSLAPDNAWGGSPGLRVFEKPDDVLVLLGQTLPPFGIMVGIYMCWVGANEPGGAFQGGAILAAMWLLVMMAGLQRVPTMTSARVRQALVVGPIMLLLIGIAGMFLADAFLDYPEGYAKPLIVVVEVTLTLSIGATLALLSAGPPQQVTPP